MDTDDIRTMIRQSLRRQISEATNKLFQPPTTFEDFRRQVSMALAGAKAPEAVFNDVADLNYEDGPLLDCLWNTWISLEAELRQLRKIPVEMVAAEWSVLCRSYVIPLVYEITEVYSVDMMHVNPHDFAEQVVDVMLGVGRI